MVGMQGAERDRAAKRLTSRQIKLLVGGLVVAVTIGYLVFSAARGATAYYLTVAELEQQGPSRRTVRVAGLVVGESILWKPRDLILSFEITDEGGRLPVTYNGSRPDMFRDGAQVVVEGQLRADGVFEAHTILLTCPSKYEEAE